MTQPSEPARIRSPFQMMVAYFRDFRVLRETRMEYWGIQVINFLDSTFYFAMLTIATIFLSDDLGMSDRAAGYSVTVFTSATSLMLLVSGVCTDWLGIRRSLQISILAMLVLRLAVVGVALSPNLPHRGLIASAVLLLMVPFMAGLQTAFQSATQRFTTPRSRSAGFNLWYLFMNIGAAGIPQSAVALFVQDVDAGKPALAVNAGQPLNPASVMKLVTTFAALELLGPSYTWRTEAYLAGPLAGEVLDGDLVLKGYGDPRLTIENFWLFVRALRARGLREIRGDLVLDRSFFDVNDHDPARFDSEPLRPYNVGADAPLVNYKAVRIQFLPDAAAKTVAILPEPRLAQLEVANGVRAGDASSRAILSSIGGWVLKSVSRPPPESGLTMNMCDVAGLASLVSSAKPCEVCAMPRQDAGDCLRSLRRRHLRHTPLNAKSPSAPSWLRSVPRSS